MELELKVTVRGFLIRKGADQINIETPAELDELMDFMKSNFDFDEELKSDV